MNPYLRTGAWLALALWLGGCSTLSGDFHQKLQIDAVDAQNRPIDGMPCQVGSGNSAITVVTPAHDVRVRRSAMPLQIECRLDSRVAAATVKPRRERMEEALLPFGSAGVFIDHLSGSLYSYPTSLHLRVGQRLVLEHGGEAQVASAEAIPPAPQAARAPPQPIVLADVQPAPPATPARSAPAAAAPKPHAPDSKADRAAARPVKTASTAPAAARSTAGAPAASAKERSAPVNW